MKMRLTGKETRGDYQDDFEIFSNEIAALEKELQALKIVKAKLKQRITQLEYNLQHYEDFV